MRDNTTGATGDYEWYDPDAVTTKGGSLQITIDEEPTRGFSFRSGMLQVRLPPSSSRCVLIHIVSSPGTNFGTLRLLAFFSRILIQLSRHSFTGGYIEVSVQLPGRDSISVGPTFFPLFLS